MTHTFECFVGKIPPFLLRNFFLGRGREEKEVGREWKAAGQGFLGQSTLPPKKTCFLGGGRRQRKKENDPGEILQERDSFTPALTVLLVGHILVFFLSFLNDLPTPLPPKKIFQNYLHLNKTINNIFGQRCKREEKLHFF